MLHADEVADGLAELHRLPRAHWGIAHFENARRLLAAARSDASLPVSLQLPSQAWQVFEQNPSDGLVYVFVERLAAQQRESANMAGNVPSRASASMRRSWQIGRSWAGRKILRSRFHSSYLRFRQAAPATSDRSFHQYRAWIVRDQATIPKAHALRERSGALSTHPKISLLLAVHNPPLAWLRETVASVLGQAYQNWELCISDDASTNPQIRNYIQNLAAIDARIHVTLAPAHIGVSAALNAAAALATGAYIANIDHDDVLPYWALYYVAEGLQRDDVDILYTDEDFIDSNGRRRAPHFKPDWSPTLLESCMYFGHLVVMRRQLFDDVGGYRTSYDGAQDYDLALRVAERSTTVVHVPKIAYYWRMHPNSVAADRTNKPYTHAIGLEALRSAAARRSSPDATVTDGEVPNLFFLDRGGVAPSSVDVLVTGEPGLTEAWISRLRTQGLNAYASTNGDAASLNRAVAAGQGTCLIFLDADLKPDDKEWCSRLIQALNSPSVGIAGARTLTRTGLIDEAGLALGMSGSVAKIGHGTSGSPLWLWLDAAREVSAVSLRCLAIRRDLFDKLNGFDKAMPKDFLAVDLCLRARERGLSTVLEPRACLRVSHSVQTLPPAGAWQVFLARWAPAIAEPDPYFSPNLAATDDGLAL